MIQWRLFSWALTCPRFSMRTVYANAKRPDPDCSGRKRLFTLIRIPWVTAVDIRSRGCRVPPLEATGRRMKGLPPGKRYITKAGFERLREQFRVLLHEERPRVTHEVAVAAAHGDRSENYEYKLGKRKLREIDAKIHRLQKQLEAYEVVDPRTRQRTDRVFFGATVTLEDEDGVVTTYQIVGGDELDESLGE